MKLTNAIRVMAASLALAAGCNGDGGGGGGPTFAQVERLARPAIVEGLFVTHDFANAVNAISPADEPAALAANPALANEAVTTLQKFAEAGGNARDPNDIVAALIPDVMRIDTTIQSTGSAYANQAVPVGVTGLRPVAGRKIEDDVIDLTYFVLTDAALSDGVGYAGQPLNPAQPGHKAVQSSFPFLADPN